MAAGVVAHIMPILGTYVHHPEAERGPGDCANRRVGLIQVQVQSRPHSTAEPRWLGQIKHVVGMSNVSFCVLRFEDISFVHPFKQSPARSGSFPEGGSTIEESNITEQEADAGADCRLSRLATQSAIVPAGLCSENGQNGNPLFDRGSFPSLRTEVLGAALENPETLDSTQ
ncbi:hypothetical protein containing NUDIX hydrolase domain protein [Anopheles sinensis]|uniref:Uncharacterized protein n=1 Tax=Anopheles sinensis TaxID=74873 RepID=A0A084W858_ANOSI|nr:hypothetical protein containing NUDIX hydrolase domain protein [Anopheles sinensis]